MQDRMRMHVLHSFDDLANDDSHAFLWKSALFLHEIKEMAVWAELNEEVDIVTIIEEIVEFHDVWMVEEPLQFDLACDLPNYPFPFV